MPASLYIMRINPLPSIGCFLLLGGFVFAVIGTVACIRDVSTEWIEAPGIVTRHDAMRSPKKGAKYKPCIHYIFYVDQQEVCGTDCTYRSRRFRSRDQAVNKAKADYDGAIPIWYNKNDPSDSRVQASRIDSWLPAMLGGSLAAVAGFFLLLFTRKRLYMRK